MAHNIFAINFTKIYAMYIDKIERKGRTKQELDSVICWLTGLSENELTERLAAEVSLEEFFSSIPNLNENAHLIKGSICGYKIDEIQDPLMKKIRYLDKLVDELAKGKSMDKILRK